ncbi:MAG: redoxin domain-containing protein [Saprospiraceae bacterium]|nr:redoxin domain-containing protein [Saprospiraceae bacterium]
MSVKVGEKAPVFSLYSSDKELIALENFKSKKVLLLFFPLAFTSTCTAELCAMRDDISNYNNLNTQILAISVDSPQTLNRFKQDQNLNFTLLSDFNKEVSRIYDALYEEFSLGMRGVSKRAAFVIDKEGTVRYAEVLESAGDLPNFEAIKQILTKLN